MHPAIRVRALDKTFPGGRKALSSINLEIAPGEMVALIGASGSGKSTLLRHISGLMASDASSCSIDVGGQCVQQDGRIAGDVRAIRSGVGFVFQQFNLVDRLPVLTNVLAGALHRLPLWRGLVRAFPREEKIRAMDALLRVGIADCCRQRASTLSGGQQQRAAIARALVQGARVILADEPIASLDPESSRRVMDILQRVNREDGVTVVVTLHQVNVALKYCPRVVALRDGRVVFDGPSQRLSPALLRELYGAEADEILETDPISTLDARPQREPRRAQELVLAAEAA